MFSVGIVLYNHKLDDVGELLVSLAHSAAVSQIWLVDNGGADWASNYDISGKIRYVKSPGNVGFGAGHNIAISMAGARSAYHIICNPDISVESEDLTRLLQIIGDRNEAVYMPNVVYPDGTRQELCKLLPSPLNLIARRFFPALAERLDYKYLLRMADYNSYFFAPSLSGCFMVCNSLWLNRLGGFDERYFMYMEDVDLSRRLAESGGALFIPEIRVVHAFEKGSYKNPLLLKYHIKSAIAYFNKWGWIFDSGRRRLNRMCLSGLLK